MTKNPAYKLCAAAFVTLPLKRATIRVATQRSQAITCRMSFPAAAIIPSGLHSCEASRTASWKWSHRARVFSRAGWGSSPMDHGRIHQTGSAACVSC